MATRQELVKVVKAHALAHYEDGGWDVIVECWTDEEILQVLDEDGATDEASAIDAFASLTAIWADRQADARNSAF